VSPVKYELGFYIPEDGILHSRHHENLKSCNVDEDLWPVHCGSLPGQNDNNHQQIHNIQSTRLDLKPGPPLYVYISYHILKNRARLGGPPAMFCDYRTLVGRQLTSGFM
jgi:hypothetical protein